MRAGLTTRATQAVPLADAARLWTASRRTALARVCLAAALLALLAASLVAALRLHTRPTSYFSSGGGGLVVADFSKSIDPRSYQRMSQILRTLADSDQRIGLIVFSDDAYEMLPAGTRGDEVRPMLRFFRGDALTLAGQETPWSSAFLGGTQIGQGLQMARLSLEREDQKQGSVLLVSDLDDAATDVPLLTSEIELYRRAGIRLRVAPLFPAPENVAFFTSLAGRAAILGPGELLDNSKAAERRSVVGGFPLWLFLGGGLLLLGLAANERLTRRLEWRPV